MAGGGIVRAAETDGYGILRVLEDYPVLQGNLFVVYPYVGDVRVRRHGVLANLLRAEVGESVKAPYVNGSVGGAADSALAELVPLQAVVRIVEFAGRFFRVIAAEAVAGAYPEEALAVRLYPVDGDVPQPRFRGSPGQFPVPVAQQTVGGAYPDRAVPAFIKALAAHHIQKLRAAHFPEAVLPVHLAEQEVLLGSHPEPAPAVPHQADHPHLAPVLEKIALLHPAAGGVQQVESGKAPHPYPAILRLCHCIYVLALADGPSPAAPAVEGEDALGICTYI